jgi:hypothetical protein
VLKKAEGLGEVGETSMKTGEPSERPMMAWKAVEGRW